MSSPSHVPLSDVLKTSTQPGGVRRISVERLDPETERVTGTLEFDGVVLGTASSQQSGHRGHPNEDYARERHVKCSACRWTEGTLYRRYTDAGSDYVVVTLGVSEVPEEIDLQTITETSSAYEVLEVLTVRPRNGSPFIPPPYARVLAQASAVDDDIRDAYLNRAVA